MEDFYETADEPQRFGELAAARWSSRVSPRSSRWPCRRRCRSRGSCPCAPRSAASPRCATPSATRSTSWSTATPARRRRMGHLQFAQALEPFGLYFLEEPCWPESADDLAAIKAAVATPIATGERVVGVHGVPRAVREGRVQRLPARHHALRRAHRGAADRGARGGLPHRARAAQPAGAGVDRRVARVRLSPRRATSSARRSRRRALARTRSRPRRIGSNGRDACVPSDRPGLGVEIDLDVVAKHPFEPELLQRVFYADGSVGDW